MGNEVNGKSVSHYSGLREKHNYCLWPFIENRMEIRLLALCTVGLHYLALQFLRNSLSCVAIYNVNMMHRFILCKLYIRNSHFPYLSEEFWKLFVVFLLLFIFASLLDAL